jgi:hypothetical protein
MRRAILFGGALFLLAGCGEDSAVEPAEQTGSPVPAPPSQFLRFRRLGGEDGVLETAATTYRDRDGRTVTLVSAVHLADEAHYEMLRRSFEGFDAVLYELIAEPDQRPSPDDPAGGTLSGFQRILAQGFELQFQIDAIDYTATNFVHADLTPREFSRLQEERGESFIQLAFRAMSEQMRMLRDREAPSDPTGSPDLVSAFRAGYGRHALRMMFATQIEDIERLAAGFAGPDGESVIVEARNARAMEVLDRELASGVRKAAIYYGAAHMPDFEERLLGRGFAKVAEEWSVAWDCHKRPDKKRGEDR